MKGPGGAWHWHPINCEESDMVPQVDGSNKKVLPMMTTADMSMKVDPIYNKICKKFIFPTLHYQDVLFKKDLTYLRN